MHIKAMQNESVSALNGLLESDYHKAFTRVHLRKCSQQYAGSSH